MLERLSSDVAFAWRSLRKKPAFAASALATLAVGIGIASAVFTVVNGVLVRPLPYADPSRLEIIWLSSTRAGLGKEVPLSAGFYLDLEAGQHSFSSVAAFQPWTPAMSAGGKAEAVNAARITPSLFGTLGAHPVIGRALATTDAEAGAPGVVVISDALWRRRFGGDRNAIGSHVDLEGRDHTVVGVMPPGFAFPRGDELPAYAQFGGQTDLWAPLAFNEADRREYHALVLFAIGRLAPGVNDARARGDLGTVLETSLKKQPPRNNLLTYDMLDLRTQAARHVRGPLLFLLAASVFVLLVACANVANLLVARTSTRRREFAVRAALGAGRARIARQLVTENLLLGALGCALGVAASVAATRGMLALVPGSLPRRNDVAVDWRVAAAAAILALLIGGLLGLVSVIQIRGRTLAGTLRDAGARSTIRRRAGIGRSALVIGEIALAIMLVIGAMLLTTTFVRLSRVARGFDASNALTAGVLLPVPGRGLDATERAREAAFYAQLVERLSHAPGVVSVAATSTLPLTSIAARSVVRIVGEPAPEPGKIPLAEYLTIEGQYFHTMGIRLFDGREFGSADDDGGAPVVIVNRQFERTYLGGHALGRQLLTPFDASGGTVPRTVVGVVDDVSNSTLDEAPRPEMFLPSRQLPSNGLFVVMRTTTNPAGALSALRRELGVLDSRAAIGTVETLELIVDRSMARQRFAMSVMAVFASSALFLTVVGLYGVITVSVGERRREMGVRMALGAKARDVVGLVLGEGIRVTAVGITIGLMGALALNRFVSAMLFGVSPTNGPVYASAVAVIAGVALIASFAPALQAARVDPAVVLRTD